MRAEDRVESEQMKLKQTKFHGIAEDITILSETESEGALVRLSSYHQVPMENIRAELARGLKVCTCGAIYEVYEIES